VSRVRFIEIARAELLHEVAYYSERDNLLGRRFGDAVAEAVVRALAFPLAGTPSVSDTRSLVVTGFPFRIIYSLEPDGIVILAIAHHARKPKFWQSRAGERSGEPSE
jgi:toxin ParE1/3/4